MKKSELLVFSLLELYEPEPREWIIMTLSDKESVHDFHAHNMDICVGLHVAHPGEITAKVWPTRMGNGAPRK